MNKTITVFVSFDASPATASFVRDVERQLLGAYFLKSSLSSAQKAIDEPLPYEEQSRLAESDVGIVFLTDDHCRTPCVKHHVRGLKKRARRILFVEVHSQATKDAAVLRWLLSPDCYSLVRFGKGVLGVDPPLGLLHWLQSRVDEVRADFIVPRAARLSPLLGSIYAKRQRNELTHAVNGPCRPPSAQPRAMELSDALREIGRPDEVDLALALDLQRSQIVEMDVDSVMGIFGLSGDEAERVLALVKGEERRNGRSGGDSSAPMNTIGEERESGRHDDQRSESPIVFMDRPISPDMFVSPSSSPPRNDHSSAFETERAQTHKYGPGGFLSKEETEEPSLETYENNIEYQFNEVEYRHDHGSYMAALTELLSAMFENGLTGPTITEDNEIAAEFLDIQFSLGERRGIGEGALGEFASPLNLFLAAASLQSGDVISLSSLPKSVAHPKDVPLEGGRDHNTDDGNTPEESESLLGPTEKVIAFHKKAWKASTSAADHVHSLLVRGLLYLDGSLGIQSDSLGYRLVSESARGGCARAMVVLGQLHEQGRGTTKNLRKARECYEKAARALHPAGLVALAELYTRHGSEALQERGVEILRAFAGMNASTALEVTDELIGGDLKAVASRGLGYCYENGAGVRRNEETAMEFYAAAAEGVGDREASKRVAMLLEGALRKKRLFSSDDEDGSPRHESEWEAERENESRGSLSDSLSLTEPLERSSEEELSSRIIGAYFVAASQGDYEAITRLAVFLRSQGDKALSVFRAYLTEYERIAGDERLSRQRIGRSLRKEDVVVFLLEDAASQGFLPAMRLLISLPRSSSVDNERALYWALEAAKRGCSWSLGDLAQAFIMAGLLSHAATCFAVGVESNDAEMAYNLGAFYLKGWGVPKDPKEALSLWRTAVETGTDKAAQRKCCAGLLRVSEVLFQRNGIEEVDADKTGEFWSDDRSGGGVVRQSVVPNVSYGKIGSEVIRSPSFWKRRLYELGGVL